MLVFTVHDAEAVHFAFEPAAGVAAVVRILVDTVSMLFVELVEPFVAASVGVRLDAESVQLLVLPGALELFAIWPGVHTKAFHVSVFIISCVDLLVGPALDAVSISLAIFEVADKLHSVRVALLADALRLIFFELAVKDELVDVARNALTVPHVVGPVALVGLSLNVGELSVAMGPS